MRFFFKKKRQSRLLDIYRLWESRIRGSIFKKRDHASIRESVWTLIPTFILSIIAIPSIELPYFMDVTTSRVDPISTYKIIGHQWYRSYDYLGVIRNRIEGGSEGSWRLGTNYFDSYMVTNIGSRSVGTSSDRLRLSEVDNSLILPVKSNLHLLVTSTDVLHAWAVPSSGVKIDAVPGRSNHILLYIDRCGLFYGQCSEICGVNHGSMPIRAEVIDIDNTVSDYNDSFREPKDSNIWGPYCPRSIEKNIR